MNEIDNKISEQSKWIMQPETALEKEIITYLLTLAECPDISISTYRYDQNKIVYRAELSLPTNARNIVSEKLVDIKYQYDDKLIAQVQNDLLTEIGVLFIKNAYKQRVLGEVKIIARDVHSLEQIRKLMRP